jgi:hypothetical protein
MYGAASSALLPTHGQGALPAVRWPTSAAPPYLGYKGELCRRVDVAACTCTRLLDCDLRSPVPAQSGLLSMRVRLLY